MSETHRPVLLTEVLEALAIRPEGRYVDATFGRGGHSTAILQRLGEAGRLLAIDRDPQAASVAATRFRDCRRFVFRQGSFARLDALVRDGCGWEQVDGILFDLGVSSPQLDDAGRGFSFLRDGPLDMRMDPGSGPSAAEWLAEASADDIARVLRELGEERFARRIALAIVAQRQRAAIETTGELAGLIEAAVPVRERHKHPATRSFQAIRIFVNGELEAIREALPRAVDLLAPGGRLVVISFHSLEDRIVKRYLRDQARGDRLPPELPVPSSASQARLRLLGRPIRATAGEVADNPRARSAVLRAAERLA